MGPQAAGLTARTWQLCRHSGQVPRHPLTEKLLPFHGHQSANLSVFEHAAKNLNEAGEIA